MKADRELASRIRTGIETKSGRYDWASKVEVRAFVNAEIEKASGSFKVSNDAILQLQERVAELELSWWHRLKRRVAARKAKATA